MTAVTALPNLDLAPGEYFLCLCILLFIDTVVVHFILILIFVLLYNEDRYKNALA